ncbi:MAG TPA: outer membrane beta-barrel protein [Rhodanobacteraceae bacterium]|nr:outer membrane beta-barrel protein [Rhodanobacteraceae bacterium]
MRNTAIVLAIAAVFAAAPCFIQEAHAQDATNTTGADSGFFINGNVGHSYFGSGRNSGNDVGYAVNGGYRWALGNGFAIGPEIGYNDLGNVTLKNVFNSQPVVAPGKASLHGWTVGANARYNFNPNWYVSARTGLYAWNGRGMTNDLSPLDVHRNADGYYGGVGVGYDFSRQFGVGLGYDYYRAKKSDINLSTGVLGVNAEVRF